MKTAFAEIREFIRYVRRYRDPRIVATPGWLGGRARLDGTRLSLKFFKNNPYLYDPKMLDERRIHWPHVRDKDWEFMKHVLAEADRTDDYS